MDTPLMSDPPALSVALLTTRLVFGLLFAAHGTQKLFGWFRGAGLKATGEFLGQIGFNPGRTFATLAGSAELTGGLLITLGLLGPVGPALLLSVMVVAFATIHAGNGLLATSNGSELPLLYVTTAAVLAFVESGPYALDAALRIAPLWTPAISAGVLICGA